MTKKNKQNDLKYWHNISLIFARSIAMMLNENEGIVVRIIESIEFPLDDDTDMVIVYYKNKQISIMPCFDDFDEGEIVIIPDYNPN